MLRYLCGVPFNKLLQLDIERNHLTKIELLGLIGSDLFFPRQLTPINRVEIRVSLQVVVPSRESELGRFVQELLNEFLSTLILVDVGVDYMFTKHQLMDLVRIILILSERYLAHHELIEHDAERPDVHCERVAFTQDDFGSHVVWSANLGERSVSEVLVQLLSARKIA